MLTKSQVPYTGPYSVAGDGKHKGPTAKALKRAMKNAGFGFADVEMDELDEVFNEKLEVALDKWDAGNNGYGEGRWLKIRNLTLKNGDYALGSVAQKLIQGEANAVQPFVPALGPVYRGGLSILQQDLTHATDGIPLYPAFDTAYEVGTSIIAPEDMTVTRASSSRPGDACYCTGQSGIRYWFGHLNYAPDVGRRFVKGQTFGSVAINHIGGGPHCHVGVNVEGIWGAGKQLEHHSNYTHGAPLVGYQLRKHAEGLYL